MYQDIDLLCNAIKSKDRAKIDLLLMRNGNYARTNSAGTSPLLTACNERDVQTVEKLLDYGAPPHYTGHDLSALQAVLITSATEDDDDKITASSQIIELLLSAGADVNQAFSTDKCTNLMSAQHPEHLRLLLKHNPDIDAQDFENSTALHHFITIATDFQRDGIMNGYQKYADMASLLLDHGARTDLKNDKNETASSLIAQSQNEHLKSLLSKAFDHRAYFNQQAIKNRQNITKQYGNKTQITLKRRKKNF